jgi:small acid-soluble spore protein tlp
MTKPDDRRDNAQKIKNAVNATKRNIEAAEEMREEARKNGR